MSQLHPHALLPLPTADERARTEFVRTLRSQLAQTLMPAVRARYERTLQPAFASKHGRQPRDRHEVRAVLEADPHYQRWSALQRYSQQALWDAAIDTTERELPRLLERARRPARRVPRGATRGSLRLDPALALPWYNAHWDIHLQPGGYHHESVPDDLAAGAIYDLGLDIYLNGALGPENARMGELTAAYFRRLRPRARPRRVLDLGCTIGASAVAWARALPRAEVHALDVAAPVLRYAHARAEALGVPVHFAQQDAARTDFADGCFDVVVSHILLHETSREALREILAESRRLLRPGGIALHLEIARGVQAAEQAFMHWEVWNNNELFAGEITDLDLRAEALSAGFAPELTRLDTVSWATLTGQRSYSSDEFAWPLLVCAVPPAST